MRLSAHGWTMELRPELGGSILALHHAGRAVLRPGAADAARPLDSACFPLVPYANRIADGRFTHEGATYDLPRNFGADHPHSLHGTGWLRAWRVVEQAADSVVLAHDHTGDVHWPWPFAAQQRFTLAPGSVTIDLSVASLADRPVPAGLGLHAYFPCDDATRLCFTAEQAWLADADDLRTDPAPVDRFGDWHEGAPVQGDTLIDNSYSGWDGRARIVQRDHALHLAATGAPDCHLYRPPEGGFFCLEPVSHLPDAINREGMALLEPGATLDLRLALTIEG
jgi:aldose 1-epimerase